MQRHGIIMYQKSISLAVFLLQAIKMWSVRAPSFSMINDDNHDIKFYFISMFDGYFCSVFHLRSILYPGSGLIWILCQQGQDSRLQRHHRASVERGQLPRYLLAYFSTLTNAEFDILILLFLSSDRSLRSSWRAPSTCGSCATRSVMTKVCSTRTTTRLWTRSWAKGKFR